MSARLFEGFSQPFPGLEWADKLTVDEAREFTRSRDLCPDLLGSRGCCSLGVCSRGEGHRVVSLTDCYHCLESPALHLDRHRSAPRSRF